MRLFVPHFGGIAIVTGISAINAYFEPAWWLYCVLFNDLAVLLILWVMAVRLIEYERIVKLLRSSGVLDGLLAHAKFLIRLQWTVGCAGRKRVMIAAISKCTFRSWKEAEKLVDANHLTEGLGCDITDYIWPAW